MEKFSIMLTITTEKKLIVEAPDAETACNIAEAIALSTDILDDCEDVTKDAIADIVEDETDEICCEECVAYCPTCEECTALECFQVVD